MVQKQQIRGNQIRLLGLTTDDMVSIEALIAWEVGYIQGSFLMYKKRETNEKMQPLS